MISHSDPLSIVLVLAACWFIGAAARADRRRNKGKA